MRLQPKTRNLQLATVMSLSLQIIKVIFHGSLIGARDLFLTQGALGIGLSSGGGLFIADLALAFNADALQCDAGHLATRRKLSLHLGRFERIIQITISAISVAAGIYVWTLKT